MGIPSVSPSTHAAPPRSVRSRRHEIPTHLNVEDRAFFGLSVRQVLYLVTGLAGAYGLWQQSQQWSALPPAIRVAVACAVLLLAAAFALVRPQHRGLEEWVFVAAHYACVPKAAAWGRQPADPLAREQTPDAGWAVLAPPRGHALPAADREEAPRC